MTIFDIILGIALVASLGANWLLARYVTYLQRRYDAAQDSMDSLRRHNDRLIRRLQEEQARAEGFRRRAENLELALAECVAALRAIDTAILYCSWMDRSDRRRSLAHDALARIQIPDDELPTEGYPTDA